MKKLLSLILAVCCFTTLCSCGKTEPEKSTGKLSDGVQQQAPEVPAEPITVDGSQQAKTIAIGRCTAAIKDDGTVICAGDEECDTSSWTDIVQISIGSNLVGLKSDGTVVSTGRVDGSPKSAVDSWTDIIAIADGTFHTVGLKSDGTVISTPHDNAEYTNLSSWSDIVAIGAGNYNTVGLKSDGTVVAAGVAYQKIENGHDIVDVYYNTDENTDITGWNDIVAIDVSSYLTVGLKSDGTVVAAGDTEDIDLSSWSNIVAVSVDGTKVFGLKSDGTIISTDSNHDKLYEASIWNNITAIATGGGYSVIALKNDGTVVTFGAPNADESSLSLFSNIKQ